MIEVKQKIQYRFDVYKQGQLFATIPFMRRIMFSYEYCAYSYGSFTFNANSMSSTFFNGVDDLAELRVFRRNNTSEDFKLIYAAFMQGVTKTNDETGEKTISGNLIPYDYILENREFTKSYTSTDESLIVDDILQTVFTDTEDGNFTVSQAQAGFTKGIPILTNNIRNRTYTQKRALKAIQQIAQVRDTAGNPQRVRGYRIYPHLTNDAYKKIVYTPNYTYDSGILITNESITKVSLTSEWKYANHIIAYGKDGIKAEAYSSNSTAKDTFGKRTEIKNIPSITDVDELQEYADEQLQLHETNEKLFDIVLVKNFINTSKLTPGAIIRVQYRDDYYNIDASYTIYEVSVRYKDNEETVKLKVSQNRPPRIANEPAKMLGDFIKKTQQELIDLSQ